MQAPICSIHQIECRWKEAGISRAGKPYQGFFSCPQKGPDGSFCTFRPPRDMSAQAVQEPIRSNVGDKVVSLLSTIDQKLDKLIAANSAYVSTQIDTQRDEEIKLEDIPF